MHFIIFTSALNVINIFHKWLALKAFVINEVSNITKIASFFVFLYEIYFLLSHFYFKCKQERTFYYKRFRRSRPQACNFIKKETLALVFSCELCEISKNTFSYRTPPVAASEDFH